MCTNPRTIHLKNRAFGDASVRTITVPCGKCAECIIRKQSQIAALSHLQANASGQVHFITLTYDNASLPIAISEITPDGPRVIGFERGFLPDMIRKAWNGADDFMNCVCTKPNPAPPGLRYAASLCREDVKLWFKRFRKYMKTHFPDEPLNFKYLCFGEYGEKHGRPHYHLVLYGLTWVQAERLCRLWKYGFVHHAPVENRPLSTDDIEKMAQYTSKYAAKGTYTRWKGLLPYVEKPRRQSSLDFGLTDDDTIRKLGSFMMAAICSNMITGTDLDCHFLILSLQSLIGERVSLLTVADSQCPKL